MSDEWESLLPREDWCFFLFFFVILRRIGKNVALASPLYLGIVLSRYNDFTLSVETSLLPRHVAEWVRRLQLGVLIALRESR